MGWTAPRHRLFRRRGAMLAALTALLAAGSAQAQEADPIGDLLGAGGPVATAPPTVTELPAQSSPPPPATSVAQPPPAQPRPAAAPSPAPAPVIAPPAVRRPEATIASQPVFLDERQAVAGQLSAEERSYEERLRASYNSAQGLQGPLDGGWVLLTLAGQDLFALRFVDRGSGPLEGAWRDSRRPGAHDGFGFLDEVDRRGGAVTLRFSPRQGAPPTVITLSATPDGHWSGDLTENGVPRSVVMRRR